MAAHGITKPTLLAHFLKETGAGVGSEDDIQQMEGKTAFVSMAESGQ